MYMLGEQTVAWPLLKNWRVGGNWHAWLPEKQWYLLWWPKHIYLMNTIYVSGSSKIRTLCPMTQVLLTVMETVFSSSMNINICNQVVVSHTHLNWYVMLWISLMFEFDLNHSHIQNSAYKMLLIISRIAIQSSWISASCPIIYTHDPNFNFNPLDVIGV